MLQPAKKHFGIICCTGHSIDVRWNYFVIAAAALLVHRTIFELQQQQLCMCALHVAPDQAENTHWNTRKRHLCLSGNYRQFFGSWFSDLNGVKQRERSAQNGDSPVSLVVTHLRWLHGQGGRVNMGCTRSVFQCVGGLRAWPIDMCSTQGRGQK